MEWLIRVLSFLIWYLIVFGWWSNEVGDEFHYLFATFSKPNVTNISLSACYLLRLPHTLYTLVSLIVRRVWLLLIILQCINAVFTYFDMFYYSGHNTCRRSCHPDLIYSHALISFRGNVPPWPYILSCPSVWHLRVKNSLPIIDVGLVLNGKTVTGLGQCCFIISWVIRVLPKLFMTPRAANRYGISVFCTEFTCKIREYEFGL